MREFAVILIFYGLLMAIALSGVAFGPVGLLMAFCAICFVVGSVLLLGSKE